MSSSSFYVLSVPPPPLIPRCGLFPPSSLLSPLSLSPSASASAFASASSSPLTAAATPSSLGCLAPRPYSYLPILPHPACYPLHHSPSHLSPFLFPPASSLPPSTSSCVTTIQTLKKHPFRIAFSSHTLHIYPFINHTLFPRLPFRRTFPKTALSSHFISPLSCTRRFPSNPSPHSIIRVPHTSLCPCSSPPSPPPRPLRVWTGAIPSSTPSLPSCATTHHGVISKRRSFSFS